MGRFKTTKATKRPSGPGSPHKHGSMRVVLSTAACQLQHDQPEGFVLGCGHTAPWCACSAPTMEATPPFDIDDHEDVVFDPHAHVPCTACGGAIRRGMQARLRWSPDQPTFDSGALTVFALHCAVHGIPLLHAFPPGWTTAGGLTPLETVDEVIATQPHTLEST